MFISLKFTCEDCGETFTSVRVNKGTPKQKNAPARFCDVCRYKRSTSGNKGPFLRKMPDGDSDKSS